MFESDVLDFFSRVPAWVVPALYLPIVAAVAGWARYGAGVGWGALALQLGAGWFVWTLMEYWLHRTLFHWVPRAPWGARFHFLLHGVHHVWFTDRYRLVMPPAASLPTAVVLFALLSGLAAAAEPLVATTWVYGLFAGIVFGYVVYDCTHYWLHHVRPTTALGLALRSHHNKHHHNPRYADKKFGVSTTIWDHVFGTYE